MKFKEYLKTLYEIDDSIEERTLLEAGASLARIMSTLKSGMDFVIITAFRANENLATNQSNNNDLLQNFRLAMNDTKGFGAYRLIGHWKECSIPLPDGAKIDKCTELGGTITDSLEESWLIPNPKNYRRFFGVALQMARKYKQDAIVARIHGDFGLFGKDGKRWEKFGAVSDKTLNYGFSRLFDRQGYTETKKMRNKGRIANIIFEGISIPNPSNSSSMLYKAMNLLYQ